MDFIQTSNKQLDKFGLGKHGFAAGNPGLGVLATYLSNVWCDSVQQELMNVIEAAGLAANPASLTQLLQAIKLNSSLVGVDTGVANAAVVTYSPVVPALVDGMVLWFQAAATNTGPTTLNVNGLGAKAVVGAAHAALQGGEIFAGGKCQLVWSATLNSFVLIECSGGALQVGAATRSQHSPQVTQVQSGALVNAVDTGTANAKVVTYAPAITALVDGMTLGFKATSGNTGAATLNVNGLGALAIVGLNNSALQGGEILTNCRCTVVYSQAFNVFVLVSSQAGPLQIAAATQLNHAVRLDQFSNTKASTGIQRLPNGLIQIWGQGKIVANANGAGFTWPFAFPNAALRAVACDVGGTAFAFGIGNFSATSFAAWRYPVTAGDADFQFIAWGW